ncbi:Guanine nucleotide-binding protein-like 1 [Lamellibrachia satsuma]|nr:Guanine nucleotide-binding protein-like 1 [Lamellibrachia satsuma]
MPPHRKKPFSAKQKKEQLKAKKERKRQKAHDDDLSHSDSNSAEEDLDINRLNEQPAKITEKGYDPNKYQLHFAQETKKEINKRKEEAAQPLTFLPEVALEIDTDDVYRPGSVLDMPKRPPWRHNMSKHELKSREEAYFKRYLDDILAQHRVEELSYVELNLETWRQLWRVLEMSDIVLLITDIRHPVLHFSPALYNYVTKELGKALVVVLNKIDLAPPALVVAWTDYLTAKFPQLHIVHFTSFPKDSAERNEDPRKAINKRRRKGAYSAMGPQQLLQVCEHIVDGKVDLASWRRDMVEDSAPGLDNATGSEVEVKVEHEEDFSYKAHQQYRDGVLTIGCCGYPNVGKSSLINGLIGRKVVSVSKTPGHTKHFQTIFLTPTVKLCDCPGLVFPSLIPKPLQILAGILPDRPEGAKWSAYDICEAWALKRGFLTARVSRPDVYRGANSILRLAVEGRLCMCTRPPGYTAHKECWQLHPQTREIAEMQEHHRKSVGCPSDLLAESSPGSDLEEEESGGEEGEEMEGVATKNPFLLLADD